MLILTVVYSAYVGGLRPALVSVAMTVLYALHYFAEPGLPLRYTAGERREPRWRWPCSALLAGAAGRRGSTTGSASAEALEVSRADAEALSRRFAFLEQASLILSSARDFDAIFRDLARLLVPTLADWCTIHVATEDGALRFVAGAHRDPSRDLVVRALAEYGAAGAAVRRRGRRRRRWCRSTTRCLRATASDAEQLKLYRALAPTAVLRAAAPGPRPAGRLHHPGDGERLGPPLRRRRTSTWPRSWRSASGRGGGQRAAAPRRRGGRPPRPAGLRGPPQPMWVFDVDTLAFLAVNDAAVHHYGWTREEFLGMTIMDLLAPDDAGAARGRGRPRAAAGRGGRWRTTSGATAPWWTWSS